MRFPILALTFAIVNFLSLNAQPTEDKPFVSASLVGQLGNNMFQVAVASAMAWDNNALPCFPDLSPSSPLFQHVFFRCAYKLPPNRSVSFTWHEKLHPFHHIPFHPDMNLFGYFQTEKYFVHYRQRILDLFTPNSDDSEYINAKYGWISDHPNAVGVQVRYYKWECPSGYPHPQYDKDFLEKAMSTFPEDTLFIISSNNLDFVRKNLPSWANNVYFLENEPNYIDLFVLSLCKHQIITNSSFGWWAAWLNQNPDKKVIYPRVWLLDKPTHDTCPKNWIAIDAKYY